MNFQPHCVQNFCLKLAADLSFAGALSTTESELILNEICFGLMVPAFCWFFSSNLASYRLECMLPLLELLPSRRDEDRLLLKLVELPDLLRVGILLAGVLAGSFCAESESPSSCFL